MGIVILGDGYITDIGYTSDFYSEMAPSHLAFSSLVAGCDPGGTLRPGRVLELGFGQGFGLALLAAANPDIVFEGCDFNPAHVAHARDLVESAGLTNLSVAEASFEAMAARAGDGNVDIVLLHGVLSWVAKEAEEAILQILRQRLRRDGALYISYNCLPGWAPLVPIRQLIIDIKRRHAGNSQSQIAAALDLLAQLKEGNATYFACNPMASVHLEAMLAQDRVYLAHEYLSDHWRLFQFSEVAARLGQADGLGYIASATLTENFDQFAVPANLQPLMAQTGDPILRETLRDVAANKNFRRDIFGRASRILSKAERREFLGQMLFAPAVPRRRQQFKFRGPLNELIGKEDFYSPIADMLAERFATFDELLALPSFGEHAVDRLVECLALLIHSGQVVPFVMRPTTDPEPARRFNRMIVDRARGGRLYGYLASPVAGTGIRIDDFGLLTLAAVFDGKADTPLAAARHGLSIITALGRRPFDNARALTEDDEAIEFLSARMKPVIEDDIPLWRRLGML
ncbi:methyltransferase regulatory domain-containing protein [Labrys okinawensis]|uniref:methyltransferase regulatory domain-containing protein n=1 Tax=Labrys okinawensis TaxID=346911 RepID=UPI0039BD3ABD